MGLNRLQASAGARAEQAGALRARCEELSGALVDLKDDSDRQVAALDAARREAAELRAQVAAAEEHAQAAQASHERSLQSARWVRSFLLPCALHRPRPDALQLFKQHSLAGCSHPC